MTDSRTNKAVVANNFLEAVSDIWYGFTEFVAENLACVFGTLVILLIIAGLLTVALPVTFKGTVTDYRWENTIEVKRYTFCSESGWDLPEGATVTKTQQEVHHYWYQTVHVGKTTTTIPHPVYMTKYYYTIYRWKNVEPIVTGAHDRNIYYAETDLPTAINDPAEGDLIQGNRYSICYVTVLDKNGNQYEEAISYNDWVEYEIGSDITYKTTLMNHWTHKVKGE
jgi:hypothetical protein